MLLADYPVHSALRRMLNQTGRAQLRKQWGKGPVWQPVWKDNCQSCMQWGEHSYRFASTLCEELCNVEGSQRHGLIHPLLARSSPEDWPGGWKRTAQQSYAVKTKWWSKQKVEQRTTGFISVAKIFTFSIFWSIKMTYFHSKSDFAFVVLVSRETDWKHWDAPLIAVG